MRYQDVQDFACCPRIGRAVFVRRAEGRCRGEHGCEQCVCPLARHFGPPAPTPLSRMLAAALAILGPGDWRRA